jgi:UDP-2,4-diacetamido-2,4,6-trideoxy-beta-L-altropyranose hydrolase
MIPPAATPRKPSRAPRVLFFADAGDRVGGGHVMRGLTLAQALRDRGAVCGFVATPAAAGILDVFAGEGIARIAGAGDAAGLAEAARDWAANAVVVDHYRFDAAAEALLRAPARPLMVMDDLRRAHDCDLILDSNLGRTAGDYPGVQTLAGPDFALVRPDFVALRDETLARRAPNPPPRRILISLGLTDVGGITARVVHAVLPDLRDRALDVVIGAGAPSRATLETLAAQDARISLHIDTQAMPALTAAADLAIGAGGSSVWERCCLGLPSLTVILADNQRPNALALEAAGAAVTEEAAAPDFEDRLPAALHRLSADPIARAALIQAAARLCDGQGAGRVAERLLALIAGDSPRHGGLR